MGERRARVLVGLAAVGAALGFAGAGGLLGSAASEEPLEAQLATAVHTTPEVDEAPIPAVAPAPAATPNGRAVASPTSRGITFDVPVRFESGGVAWAAVLATNTTNQVASFAVTATYTQGGTVVATAVGAVNDLPPGATRAVTLRTAAGPVPAGYDAVHVAATSLVTAATTPSAAAAAAIAIGPAVVRAGGSVATVDVPATNRDARPHSFTLQAAFTRGGQLIAVATGAVDDLAPGQTATARLVTLGVPTGYDTVHVGIERLAA
jgi:hypothetical protein